MHITNTIETYEYQASAQMDPGASIISFIIGIALYLVVAFFYTKIFEKAGIESWKGWVPIVNNWHLFKLGGFGGWWAILQLIPLVNLVALVIFWIAAYRIGKGFEKPGIYVLLFVFTFLLPIWAGVLAFDASRWRGVEGSAYPARA